MNWGETPSGVMSNFGTGSSTEACNGGGEKEKKCSCDSNAGTNTESCYKKVCGNNNFVTKAFWCMSVAAMPIKNSLTFYYCNTN